MHHNEDLDAVLSNMNEANDLAPKVLHMYPVLVKCLLLGCIPSLRVMIVRDAHLFHTAIEKCLCGI